MVTKLPSDFDIFSPSTCRNPLCIHTRAGGWPGVRAFGLRDLVFVVRKNQVDAAAVDIEGLAQQRVRHRRTFDVPAGAAPAPRRMPSPEARASTASTARNPSGSACRARRQPARPRSFRRASAAPACRNRASTPRRRARGRLPRRHGPRLISDFDHLDHLADVIGGARFARRPEAAQRRDVVVVLFRA